eukprot:TRINITY_DN2532_c0_g1_i1.p1 TRINITY_DN2532_c0_g1~~TRINITY_DN2532_c0_g1_i1.p1  ORF type:complete len:733 (+),score=437.96 TRINITY_DN2532_c0_g1_i1:52-2199(+)
MANKKSKTQKKKSLSKKSKKVVVPKKTVNPNKAVNFSASLKKLAQIEKLLDSKLNTENPEHASQFLAPPEELSATLTENVKDLYDIEVAESPLKARLESLLIEGFDAEQIWEQLQMRSLPLANYISSKIPALSKDLARQEKLKARKEAEAQAEKSEDDEEEDDDDDDLMDEDEEDIDLDEDGNEIGDDLDEDDDDDDIDLMGDIPSGSDDETDDEELNKHLEKKLAEKTGKKPKKDQLFSFEDMEKFINDAEDQEERRENRDKKPKVKNTIEADEDEEDDEEEQEELEEEELDLMMNGGIDPDDEEFDEDNDDIETEATRKPTKKSKGDSDFDFHRFAASVDRPDEPLPEEEEEPAAEEDDEEQDETEKPLPKPMFEDDDEEENEKVKDESPFERAQRILRQRIEKFENENVNKKFWALKGEVQSKERPVGSLLEVDVDYENLAKRSDFALTTENVRELENTIKRRIIEESYDDVLPKLDPLQRTTSKRTQLELDHEKSKLSLAEIYERDYSRTILGFDEEKVKMSAEKKEIDSIFVHLMSKLSAMSSFHFTPKLPKQDITVSKRNIPSIMMEEVAPVTFSDATKLAPEQIHKKNGVLQGDSEMNKEDRLRKRKAEKVKKHKRLVSKDNDKKVRKRIADKVEALTGIPASNGNLTKSEKASVLSQKSTSIGVVEKQKKYTRSTEFFGNLRNDAASQKARRLTKAVATRESTSLKL